MFMTLLLFVTVEESTPSFELVERDELPVDPSDDDQTRICPAGTFSKTGASECSPCLNGTYAVEAGSDVCQPCLPFSTTNTDRTGCFACLANYYRVPFGIGDSLRCEVARRNGDRAPRAGSAQPVPTNRRRRCPRYK